MVTLCQAVSTCELEVQRSPGGGEDDERVPQKETRGGGGEVFPRQLRLRGFWLAELFLFVLPGFTHPGLTILRFTCCFELGVNAAVGRGRSTSCFVSNCPRQCFMCQGQHTHTHTHTHTHHCRNGPFRT